MQSQKRPVYLSYCSGFFRVMDHAYRTWFNPIFRLLVKLHVTVAPSLSKIATTWLIYPHKLQRKTITVSSGLSTHLIIDHRRDGVTLCYIPANSVPRTSGSVSKRQTTYEFRRVLKGAYISCTASWDSPRSCTDRHVAHSTTLIKTDLIVLARTERENRGRNHWID